MSSIDMQTANGVEQRPWDLLEFRRQVKVDTILRNLCAFINNSIDVVIVWELNIKALAEVDHNLVDTVSSRTHASL
ncbi:MAG: hypothetical protein CMJ88_04130 [Planctomycetes bacterium]|nr:hypothetical protein [Planctomycetota bacterium]